MTDTSSLRSRPLPSSWTVEAGLAAFLEENGYSFEQYDAPRTPASFLKIKFSVPNTPKHRWAIMLHDLHHIATGYGTNAKGEGEISAWELRRGIRSLGIYVGSIVLSGTMLGLVVAPIRTVRAWKTSGTTSSLYDSTGYSYEQLLAITIGDLRALLGIPREGVATTTRRNHSLAPGTR